MSNTNEQSYYEIALTNRQVVMTFVIMLVLVLAVFLCGVWVGRNDESRLATPDLAAVARGEVPTGDEELDNMKEFKFFAGDQERAEGEQPAADAAAKPAAVPPAQQPTGQSRDTTLAQDLGAATPQPAPSTKSQTAPPPSAPTTTAAPPPAASTPSPKPALDAGEGFIVQVFATREKSKADEVLQRLTSGGQRAFLSPIEVSGSTRYRVRIGPFAEKPEAESAARDVTRRFRYETWVTAASN